MVGEKERVDGYMNTINRLEPDLYAIDAGAAYASIAISAKRMADAITRVADAYDEIMQLVKKEMEKDNG